jgi:hypothetical protein
MCLQPHPLIWILAVPCLMKISSSGLGQREWMIRTARLSLVTTIYNYMYTNYKSLILPSMVHWFPIENGITASGFLLCDAEDFDDIGLTKIGKKLLLKTFTAEVKGIVNHSQVKSLCMGFMCVHCPLIIHTQYQKETIPMRGQGVKHLSTLGKQTEKMNPRSMVCTMHVP